MSKEQEFPSQAELNKGDREFQQLTNKIDKEFPGKGTSKVKFKK